MSSSPPSPSSGCSTSVEKMSRSPGRDAACGPGSKSVGAHGFVGEDTGERRVRPTTARLDIGDRARGIGRAEGRARQGERGGSFRVRWGGRVTVADRFWRTRAREPSRSRASLDAVERDLFAALELVAIVVLVIAAVVAAAAPAAAVARRRERRRARLARAQPRQHDRPAREVADRHGGAAAPAAAARVRRVCVRGGGALRRAAPLSERRGRRGEGEQEREHAHFGWAVPRASRARAVPDLPLHTAHWRMSQFRAT